MKHPAWSVLLYLTCLLDSRVRNGAEALRISGRWVPPGERRGVWRRGSMNATMPSDLVNSNNIKYFTNVTLNGQSFPALIDTGRCVHSY